MQGRRINWTEQKNVRFCNRSFFHLLVLHCLAIVSPRLTKAGLFTLSIHIL